MNISLIILIIYMQTARDQIQIYINKMKNMIKLLRTKLKRNGDSESLCLRPVFTSKPSDNWFRNLTLHAVLVFHS